LILANLATGLYRNKHALRLASKTYTVPDPVPGNGALKKEGERSLRLRIEIWSLCLRRM